MFHALKLKPMGVVKAKLRDLVYRAGNKFIAEQVKPTPHNCQHAPRLGSKVMPCARCLAEPNTPCKNRKMFESRFSVDELRERFSELVANREWVLREHRDIAMLLWVLGQLDGEEDPAEGSETEASSCRLEGNTLHISPDLVPGFQYLLQNLPQILAQTPWQNLGSKNLGPKTPNS